MAKCHTPACTTQVASEYGVENPGLPGIQKQHEARLALSQQLQTYPKDELARILKSPRSAAPRPGGE